VIRLLFENIGRCLRLVDEFDPMLPGSALAKEHGSKYPLIQGPMANISDNADFAVSVSKAGALPFFAMGNLPADLFEKIVSDGKAKLDVFGCGLIGLPALNKSFPEHIGLLKKYRVPYALIAAGYPAQANELEAAGVKCYLHCPSSSMLENAINSGVKRFIFEGMEAGGHIGTLTSFVLWEVAMETFLAQKEKALREQRIIFAGGIAVKASTGFISGMTSVLASRGASVGISVGTSYLFTREIVETGAMKPLYQKLLIENDETTVIGATLGLSTRSLYSAYAKRMIEKEHEMIREKMPLTDRKHFFESNNLGSLLIASKAFTPDFEKMKKEGKLSYVQYSEDEARDKGNYQTGETLCFYKEQLPIDAVHDLFFGHKKDLHRVLNRMEVLFGGRNSINDEIAIIGMGCVYPDAADVETYWQNIISKKYSIRDVQPERVNPDFYYSEDRKEEDKSYTRLAGTIIDFTFDHEKYGYSEYDARHMSLSQKLIIEAALQAAKDAGYENGKGLPKTRTSAIVGTCLTNEYHSNLQLSKSFPQFVHYLEQIDEFKALSADDKAAFIENMKKGVGQDLAPKLPDGAALNVESSRIVKHLNVEGNNYTIDAACATSFAALDAACKELLDGDSDVVFVGGVNTNLSPEAFVGFCKMGALSDRGSYPFDGRAGGFILGEGAGVVVLKRMKEALADGDRIQAVIKGIGASSDGKGKFIAAPSAEGQRYALRRAYENMRAPIEPDDIDFIEAHGTSTIQGDATEMEVLKSIYNGKRKKGVSSAKALVGHLLGGAGNAGLIKAVKAMQSKTLPPNGQFEKLSPKMNLEGSPLYIITEPQEWTVEPGRKRRAAVSSYGFGGINYHIVIEEFDKEYKPLTRTIFDNPDYDFNDDRIVVTGIGTIMPGVKSCEEFWDAAQSGKVLIGKKGNARFHNETYAGETDPVFNLPMVRMGIIDNYTVNGLRYKIPPAAQKVIDRAQFMALDAAGQVIEDAGLASRMTNGNRVAAFFGTSSSEKNNEQIIRTRLPFIKSVLAEAPIDEAVKKEIIDKFEAVIKEKYQKTTEDTVPGFLANITSGRVANFYNANGANFIIDAECAASAVAIGTAIKDLKAGTSDYIIAGGVDANLTPIMMMAFSMLKILLRPTSPGFRRQIIRPHDERGRGPHVPHHVPQSERGRDEDLRRDRRNVLPLMAPGEHHLPHRGRLPAPLRGLLLTTHGYQEAGPLRGRLRQLAQGGGQVGAGRPHKDL
jgi:3-oxoacyl-(acyl-carrier-protein) synthase/NAD(P)H-dependent flavin oxidoreductase YrpB (nitropropane dioxygenase family)